MESSNQETDKKLNKTDIVAISTAVLASVTAGVCLHKIKLNNNTISNLKSVINTSTKNKQQMIDKLLFPNGTGNIHFKQSNIGDCYLLSSIYGLSKNSKGQKLLKQMVTINDNGEFVVQFHNIKPIIIPSSRIKGQVIRGSGKTVRTVFGDLGLQAIERAFGQHRANLQLLQNPNQLVQSLQVINGGWSDEALKILGGLQSKSHGTYAHGTLKKQGTDVNKILDNLADNFENRIITLSTPPKNFGLIQGKNGAWMDKNKSFCCRHAYAVENIDKLKKTVTIVNPHNTTRPKTISYKEFSDIFSVITETAI